MIASDRLAVRKFIARRSLTALFLLVTVHPATFAETLPRLTSPKEAFGFNIGDDYHLATYTQVVAYWKKLAAESPRMRLDDIGPTAEGRRQYMAILSAPENIARLDHYREIAQRLALAKDLNEDQARALAAEGKAVIWIDGGIHANETVGAQQLSQLVYEMAGRTDAETLRFLNDVILLCVPANPDGMELVSDWYMREKDPLKRSLANLPRLYEKYAGHDNNRDFFMSNLPETTNMNRVLYRQWFPQVMYDHHQAGPRGAVVFIPPFRDPFNYNFDPLIPILIEQTGTAMHGRLVAEGKPGSTMRGAATYSTWYNGALRTTTYFHNMIGLLTEIIGNPTPASVPLVPERLLPSGDEPDPIAPQAWHFQQSIDYEMSQNRAILDYASRNRETLLFNIYRMGRNSIERGSRDSWTATPKRIEALRSALNSNWRDASSESELYRSTMRNPALRDPRGYILSADQPDFPTAVKFINVLLKNGIEVERATAPFDVAGKHYPADSYIVKTAQAFRPHVLDMFEPQDHPNDFQYPGGPPIAPYDVTGYTLAFQMGIRFDRILDAFDGPFETVSETQHPPAGSIDGPAHPAGYLLSHRTNDVFTVINRVLHAGREVYWLRDAVDGETGAVWIPDANGVRELLETSARELGISARGHATRPAGDAFKLRRVRIGLYDEYGGSMTSGWTRWIFEQFEFPFQLVFPKTLDAGNLNSKFDVLVFPDGAIRRTTNAPQPLPNIPAAYRDQLGSITEATTIPRLRQFAESGGTVITLGGSTVLAKLFGLPVTDALKALPREKFYIPGSLLRMKVDNTQPLAYGMDSAADVFFDSSPVFQLSDNAAADRIAPVGWFDGPEPLRSGWAWGQQHLDGGVAIAEAAVGEGKLFLLGPKVTFRAQPHGTFKLLFNGIYYGPATPTNLDAEGIARTSKLTR